MILSRQIHLHKAQSRARYAVLIQCKRVDRNGRIEDFYHVVPSSRKRQSALLLDITPASFYFLMVPPHMVETYCNIEPIAFVRGTPGCSSPVWNMGCFGFNRATVSFLSAEQKAQATSILVVPALAVQAQDSRQKSASLQDLLPNALPFWYWFAELFVPGFIGDYRQDVVAVAANVKRGKDFAEMEFGVDFSVEVSVGNG